ncbi:MAG: FGGY family carbohydrate kinase, partial [Candidatus Margulisiibacteriota bacterium]
MTRYVLALDVGTTGIRAMAVDPEGQVVATAYQEIPISFPKPAWVEQDAIDLWEKSRQVLRDVTQQIGVDRIVALGITNQRETTIVWDKATGKPVHPAIVWQCRRTTDFCQENQAQAGWIRDKTGLPLDPYFSATKLRWL